MSTAKQRDQAEALERLRDALTAAGPDGGATILIIDDGGKPSSSGRTHRLELHLIQNDFVRPAPGDDRPRERERPATTLYLTINVARALGYRLDSCDRILMGGYGYSRSHQIAEHLASLAGHPLYFDSIGGGIGNTRGWIGKPVESKRKAG